MSIRKVAAKAKTLDAYKGLIPEKLYNEVRRLARGLTDRTIANLNATDVGGGVAEILRSLVPLMKGVGLQADWYVVEAPAGFFEITKKLHNLLQGAEGELTSEEKRRYLDQCKEFAREMERKAVDIWVVHDPQPLAASAFLDGRHACKLWRSHINTSSPNQMTLEFILPYMKRYDWQIFTLREYVPPGLEEESVAVFPAAIDPLTEKNREMSAEEADAILAKLGIDPKRPLVTQVSRFDPWKDPIGVIDAYREVKREVPDLQLALVGVFSAKDDPEAPRVYADVEAHRAGDEDIHLYKDPRQVGDVEVNAFYTGSDVIMQKSIREGFGLTVTEAMWKGKPVIGGSTGGIREQIQDGVNGFLVDSVEEAAERLLELLKNPERRLAMGQAARETVHQRFLMPRLLRDYQRVLMTCS